MRRCVGTAFHAPHTLNATPLLSERRYNCVARRHAVTLHVCPLISLSTARRISLGGEGNALYPVLSSYLRRRLASGEGIVVLGVCVCVRPAANARRNAALSRRRR